jgi:hypothetical protein
MLHELQPLRIPHGWHITWNTLNAVSADSPPEEAPGGSSLFLAANEGRRFLIDVLWRPEFDPAGEYVLRVDYVPWKRDARGRRIQEPVEFRDAEPIHEQRTRSHEELVRELERWLFRCTTWVKERAE